jgi:hypothetical protein
MLDWISSGVNLVLSSADRGTSLPQTSLLVQGGYVLEFTNQTFLEFFRHEVEGIAFSA